MSMSCITITTTPGCLVEAGQPPRPVLIHTEFGLNAAGNPVPIATRYTEANAATVITLGAGQAVVPGVCPAVDSDVEFLLLCDDVDSNPATPAVQFLRRIERVTNGDTGAFISQTVTDLAMDGVTAYTVVGSIIACGANDDEFTEMIVCDAAGVRHLRRQVQVNGVFATVGFFNPNDGTTVTVPTGAVGACPSCAPKTQLGVVTSW